MAVKQRSTVRSTAFIQTPVALDQFCQVSVVWDVTYCNHGPSSSREIANSIFREAARPRQTFWAIKCNTFLVISDIPLLLRCTGILRFHGVKMTCYSSETGVHIFVGVLSRFSCRLPQGCDGHTA
jgi:hypothetical protein